MSPESVLTIAHQAMVVSLMLAGPLLLIALAVGLLISMFQAATQINETTLTFIPKLVAILATLAGAAVEQHILGRDRRNEKNRADLNFIFVPTTRQSFASASDSALRSCAFTSDSK